LARTRPDARAPLAVVYLHGELGAGKTTLAQGFLRACGVAGPVRSPTYTLVQVYALPALTVVHLDLYRLRGAEELEHLGLTEWALPGTVWVIEWPERGAGALPPADLRVSLRLLTDVHEAQLRAETAAGGAWLDRLTGLQRAESS
jgi:tRNA threonylcarbamoyladenosine biosynthesis protein TsaE